MPPYTAADLLSVAFAQAATRQGMNIDRARLMVQDDLFAAREAMWKGADAPQER